MNSDVFLKHLKEVTKNMIETNRQINERNRWRSDYGYEDDLEHDYGYESSYHNLYDTHQLPHPCNKNFPTIPSGPVSRHEPRSHSQSKPSSQVTRVVKSKTKGLLLTFRKYWGHLILCQTITLGGCPGSMEIRIFCGITWNLEVQTMKMFICEP